jgi:hypothetical protein
VSQEYYRKFILELDGGVRDSLFELAAAANYMNIKPLLDLACLGVTFNVVGKGENEASFFF